MANEINIIEQNITDTLELNYMPYAMSVIVSSLFSIPCSNKYYWA